MSRRASSRAAVVLALSCLAAVPAGAQPHAVLQGGLASPIASERLAALEDLLLGGRRGGPTLVVRLASLALEDPDARVRELAREVLAGLDSRAGCEALLEVAVALGGEEGASWITRLPRTPRAQGPLAAAAAGELEPALELAALTTLGELLAGPRASLEGLELLAEAPASPEAARARAGRAGVGALLTGLVARGDAAGLGERGEVLLREAPRIGELAARLARVALLTPGGLDLAGRWAALAVRVQRAREVGPHGEVEVALEAARAHQLLALVEVAAGRPAATALSEAEGAALRALRATPRRGASRLAASRRSASTRREALARLAEVQLTRLFDRLLNGLPAESQEALELGAALHRTSLELDVESTLAMGSGAYGWDEVLGSDGSPLQTLLLGRSLPGVGEDGGVAAARALGSVLAAASGWELAGFEPAGSNESVSMWKDPRRVELLRAALGARVAYATRLEREAAMEEPRTPPFVTRDLEAQWTRQVRRWQLNQAMQEADRPLTDRTRRLLRPPSSLALWLARDLRTEGRPAEAGELARAYGEALADDAYEEEWLLLVQERRARAALAEGAAATDRDEPVRARTVLLAAVERIEDLLGTIEQRDMGPAVREQVEALLAEALTSLAVNSNVKLGRPDEAVAWVERAHALRDDSWSRLLLACYRARAGRADEARALLRRVRPSPSLHYNLACTHALLGETDAALAWLERDLDPLSSSPGALRRQKDWAAQDPDLASLRDDSRFKALVE